MLFMMVVSLLAALLLCCLMFPSVWASLAGDDLDAHEAGLALVASRKFLSFTTLHLLERVVPQEIPSERQVLQPAWLSLSCCDIRSVPSQCPTEVLIPTPRPAPRRSTKQIPDVAVHHLMPVKPPSPSTYPQVDRPAIPGVDSGELMESNIIDSEFISSTGEGKSYCYDAAVFYTPKLYYFLLCSFKVSTTMNHNALCAIPLAHPVFSTEVTTPSGAQHPHSITRRQLDAEAGSPAWLA